MGRGSGLQGRNNLCKKTSREGVIVGIARKPRGRRWSLRPRGRKVPDLRGAL